MYKKEVNSRSPLRILDKSIHGGLGQGNLGVVMARAGVGKTAFLVQVALDDLLRDRDVLHVALGQTVEHVHAWYDALFDDLAGRSSLEDREDVRANAAKHRVIQAFVDTALTPERLESVVELYARACKFQPKVLLIDGFAWEGSEEKIGAALAGFKRYAKRLGAEVWMSAQTHRTVTTDHPTRVTPPCAAFVNLIDVAVFLEPLNDHVGVRLLKDHGDAVPPETHLTLDANTLCLIDESQKKAPAPVQLPPSAHMLLSGGAEGAEETFGANAERWGVAEINFSFSGRTPQRTRGLVELSDAELKQGDVSHAYFRLQLHRAFPTTPEVQRRLQSIWHQVNTAGEIFVVGSVLADKTVKGGTGWAVELARHWKKPVYVFDQEQKHWFSWSNGDWAQIDPPLITRTRFAGTGTRTLNEDGRAAIAGLFERSFGWGARDRDATKR